MDFRKAVIDSLDRVIASGKIEEMIEAKITKTIESILDDALRGYGDFGKAISEQVKASLKIDDRLGLPAYNDLILKIVQRQIDGQIGNAMQKQVADQLAELLQTPPAEIKLSELAKQFGEFANESYERDESERFTFGMEESGSCKGYFYIWLDAKDRKNQYDANYRLGVDGKGKVYSLTVHGENDSKRLFVGPMHGFERLLFQLKVAGTTIICDCEPSDIDTYYPDQCHCD
jgi:hypothetical protein